MDEEKDLEITEEADEEVIEEEGILDKVKKMREDLKVCKKERDEYLAGWQRAKADFINAKKEEEKSREAFIKFAEAALINDFLRVADSFEMSLKHKEDDGTKQIYFQFRDILKQHGVINIETSNKKFDPKEHEAIEQVEVDQDKDNLIIEELQKGWYLHDKVLRPAKVKVGHYKNKN